MDPCSESLLDSREEVLRSCETTDEDESVDWRGSYFGDLTRNERQDFVCALLSARILRGMEGTYR